LEGLSRVLADLSDLAVAVPAALGAAAAFGLTGAMQHEATWRVRQREALHPSLLVDLAHQPLWLASLLANGAGIVLQWVALVTAPLVLVQPLLVTGLLFAVSFTALMRRQPPDRVVLFGAALCAAGLAAFILIAQPTASRPPTLTLGSVLPLAAGLAGLLAVCLNLAAHRPGPVRTLALAVAAGVLYGVTAGMVKVALQSLDHGVGAMFTSWPIYVVAVCGPLGFLLNQNAFQAGIALAPALAVIIVLDPLVGIGIGILWLGERLRDGWPAVLGQVLALVVLSVGVVILSHRAPQVAAAARREDGRWRTGTA
jgi:drug/metabolite transporter (DMT)-like permease